MWPILMAPIIGSFLSALITRIDAPGTLVLGRSRCDSCGATLAALELVPIISWLALRGRCRSCATPIGLFYPALELAAVIVAVWAATVFSDGMLWISCALGWTLLALAVIDYKYFLLPEEGEPIFDLYDLAQDPSEERSRGGEAREEVARLRGEISGWIARSERESVESLTPAQRDAMNRLGYVDK